VKIRFKAREFAAVDKKFPAGLAKFPARRRREFASSHCGSCIKADLNRLIAGGPRKILCKIACGQGKHTCRSLSLFVSHTRRVARGAD
jgi:hypothetical protein